MEPNRYKNTIQLPQTKFPQVKIIKQMTQQGEISTLKGGLIEKEKELLHFWKSQRIYDKMVEKNRKQTRFTFVDGPPYANADIHMGTALNKILKDIIVKFQNLSGKYCEFIPGWDCHGLPIEQTVTKRLGAQRKDTSDQEIRELCRQEAYTWIGRQREQFERFGTLAQWDKPYLTLNPDYEAEEVREIARLIRNGVLYRKEKPVYWCWALQTALAEAEIEYHDHTSPSIYVKFDVTDKKEKMDLIRRFNFKLGSGSGSGSGLGSDLDSDSDSEKPVAFVIWTTTPWTLPANTAIALNPDFTYGLYETENNFLILHTELKGMFESETRTELQLKAQAKGDKLEGLYSQHPFLSRRSMVILGEHVTADVGTGCVHTAPGHGPDDYVIGLRYNLPVISPLDEAGKFTDEVPFLKGEFVFDANSKIIKLLKEKGSLLGHKEISHSYPHCWRSKTPLIFRATPQWFIEMDNPQYNIRKRALESVAEIQFFPTRGRQRLQSMIESRPDWCLSRQRIWGVPMPVYYCKKCASALANADVIDRIAEKMQHDGGIEAYFNYPASDFTLDKTCFNCGHSDFEKGKDIIDVWFDSGSCHAAVQKKGLGFPADVYIEGSDQHRGWFQSSLLSSIATCGEPPFRALVTHGFVTDANGRKMSKSLGNVIDPVAWAEQTGAEVLRLWAAHEDYGEDLTCGPESLTRVTETYRRFRNTMRFLLGNIFDFDPQNDGIKEISDLIPVDQWALARLNELIENATECYSKFEFYKVYHQLNHFMTVELSAQYLDIVKDRLYTGKKDGRPRRSAQTVLWNALNDLVVLMAPIASFLAEETYQHFPKRIAESVFLLSFPQVRPEWKNSELLSDFVRLGEIKNIASKELEQLRQSQAIGSSLDARLEISCSRELNLLLKKYESHLAEFFIVSQVSVRACESSQKSDLLTIVKAEKALGKKCERCWNYDVQTDSFTDFPGLCSKCVRALS